MREYLRVYMKIAVAFFCVWHIAAVALYAIPTTSTDPLSLWVRRHLTPHVAPYMLVTSQWQQWNLFSPDPLRRIHFYRIDALSGSWMPVAMIDTDTYRPWPRHAVRFKILGQAFDTQKERPALTERAAQVLCTEVHLGSGTRMRIWRDTAEIPLIPRSDARLWRTWQPVFLPTLALDTTCLP